MDRARVKVDFNELVAKDLVLLSKADVIEDSEGDKIIIEVGKKLYIYEYNKYDNGEEEYLFAEGVAELNDPVINGGWTRAAKWCCRLISDDNEYVTVKKHNNQIKARPRKRSLLGRSFRTLGKRMFKFNFMILVYFSMVSVVNSSSIHEQLHEASKVGDSSRIRELVKLGADVNSIINYSSPLFVATNWNKLDAVKVLLELGADVNYNIKGNTILLTAVGRDTEIVRLLIEGGAKVNIVTEKFSYSPLVRAAGNQPETFLRLKEKGSYKGSVPNILKTVNLLIEAKADVNHVDEFEESPLRAVVRVNNFFVAQALLKAGANVHQRIDSGPASQRGNTILMEALGRYELYRDLKVIKLLLDFGANPNDRNEEPYSEHWERHGGSPWRGYSVLTFAAKNGRAKLVDLLLNYGANPVLPRTDGVTPLEIANSNGCIEMVDAMKSHIDKLE